MVLKDAWFSQKPYIAQQLSTSSCWVGGWRGCVQWRGIRLLKGVIIISSQVPKPTSRLPQCFPQGDRYKEEGAIDSIEML